MSTPGSILSVIRAIIRAELADVHTMIPGRVTAYDGATQRASVQPLLKSPRSTEDGGRTLETLPIVPDVPVAFLGAGSWSITFPVSVGDTGMIMFAEAALERWKGGDGDREVDPADDTRFGLDGAVFVPGLRATPLDGSQTSDDALVVAGADIRIGSADAADPAAGQAALEALKSAISGAATTPGDGGAAFKAAILLALAAWPANAVATKVKIE